MHVFGNIRNYIVMKNKDFAKIMKIFFLNTFEVSKEIKTSKKTP